jgi:hypothetical protein
VLSERLEHRVYNAPGFTVAIRELADAATAISGLVCEFTEPGRPVKFVRWDTTRYEQEFDFRLRPMADWMRQEVSALLADHRNCATSPWTRPRVSNARDQPSERPRRHR